MQKATVKGATLLYLEAARERMQKINASGQRGKRNSPEGFQILTAPDAVYTIGARLNGIICSRCSLVFERGARVKLDLTKHTKPNGIMHEVCPRKRGFYA